MNRRNNSDGMKGHKIVTLETENETGGMVAFMGRRKFLALGGVGAAVLVGTAGVARALITAGGPNPTPRSQMPVGLDPATGREPTAVAQAQGGVYRFALAGTDGWVSFPSASNEWVAANSIGGGAANIDPYFPDPLADPANRTTYAFCFRNVTNLDQSQVAAQKGRTQTCAPLFFSTVGEEIWVTLSNLGLQLRPDLVDGHTLHWHGFRNAIPFYDGVPESSIAVPIGRDFTYVYRPEDAGTYMYHCHFEDVEHVTMGMHGIVFVRPAEYSPTSKMAYGVTDGDALAETAYDREYAIMLSEVDTRAHFSDAHIQATDWTDFHADFWTMNGRAYPDTLEPNGTRNANGDLEAQRFDGFDGNGAVQLTNLGFESAEARLASQPLSSLVQAQPGERILIRFANLGFLDHTIVFPGLEIDVLGRDARFVPASAQRTSTDSIQIGPGESRDVFFTAPALTAGSDEDVFAFYDRGMSHYTGGADGNEWVGGQRSEIRVRAGLADQLKPNGWAGEGQFVGEFPLKAAHEPPVASVTGSAHGQNQPTFVDLSVAVDSQNPGTYLANLWYATTPTNTVQAPAQNTWRAVSFNAGHPTVVTHVQVRGGGFGSGGTRKYWFFAQDSAGANNFTSPTTLVK